MIRYRARRRMNLSGTDFRPGDWIEQKFIETIPDGRLHSLLRVGHIIEVRGLAEDEKKKAPARKKKAPAKKASAKTADSSPSSGGESGASSGK